MRFPLATEKFFVSFPSPLDIMSLAFEFRGMLLVTCGTEGTVSIFILVQEL